MSLLFLELETDMFGLSCTLGFVFEFSVYSKAFCLLNRLQMHQGEQGSWNFG